MENEHRIRQAARNVKKFLQFGTNMAPPESSGKNESTGKKKLAATK